MNDALYKLHRSSAIGNFLLGGLAEFVRRHLQTFR
jgi:hypothetical protein